MGFYDLMVIAFYLATFSTAIVALVAAALKLRWLWGLAVAIAFAGAVLAFATQLWPYVAIWLSLMANFFDNARRPYPEKKPPAPTVTP